MRVDITDDIYLPNGGLDIQGLDEKLNTAFEAMQLEVNSLMDVRIMKQLLGAQLKTNETGDLRQLLFLLIMIDKEREKDHEIDLEADWKPNSYYIELFETEKLRDYYLCRLDNPIVNLLFAAFQLDYLNPETLVIEGIGSMVIKGTEVPFKIY